MNTSILHVNGLLLATLFLSVSALAQPEPEPIKLWPGQAPFETSPALGEEKDMSKPGEGLVSGRPLIRLGNVSTPTLSVYPPPADQNTGAAVMVCPGGGYHILAMDLEGTEIIEWLNSMGVTGILLKYRVPVRPHQERYTAPLADAQRALGLARHRAKEFGIDPKRIGVMGFSAGAHLSAALSNNYRQRSYAKIDAADEASCRPDFTLLIYPAYLVTKEDKTKVSPELSITSQTPPTFIVQTQDDSIPVESSLFYYLDLKNAQVPVEMHLYPKGGHGYGLRPSPHNVARWPQRARDWMKTMGFLETPGQP